MTRIAIVGGGPAGLFAAETAAHAGATVTLFDAKPSVGRKFLVAGRGGLNLTHAEPLELFISRYRGGPWNELIAGFDPEALRAWARQLGVETFAASTGRVYPKELQGAQLLRRWVQRLRGLGVEFALHHRWETLRPGEPLELGFPAGSYQADAVVFALGGGSWPQTGSDGSWTNAFTRLGISVAPLRPANCGWEVAWPAPVLAAAEGLPLKNIAASAGDQRIEGELMITRYGLEGGPVYALGPVLRSMEKPLLRIDLKPSSNVEQLAKKLEGNPARAPGSWRLAPAASALLQHYGGAQLNSCSELAALAKGLPVPLTRPRPIAEAISSAGGVAWEELDPMLMLRKLPGVFVAGEMVDWEAPTGGYLLQGCFASGKQAALGAIEWIRKIRGAEAL